MSDLADWWQDVLDDLEPDTTTFTITMSRPVAEASRDAARRVLEAQEVVNEQAEDEGLWFMARTAPEAYLQQELRRLHAVIEEGVGDE